MRRLKISDLRKILIIRPDRIGDLVLALPLASLLKEFSPHLEIHYLASSYAAPLLRYSPHVDDYLLYTGEDGDPLALSELVSRIEKNGYDAALFAKPNWRSALAVFLAGIKVRIGTSRRPYSFLFNVRESIARRNSNMHEVDLNLELLRILGLPNRSEPLNPELRVSPMNRYSTPDLNLPEKYVVIHIGSKGSAPNWPKSRYKALAESLSEILPVVLTGQEEIAVCSDNIIDMIGKTSLDQLIRLIDRAELVISGSTGPMHLAAALGRKILAFFPDHPALGPHRWGPRGGQARILQPGKQKGHRCRITNEGTCECFDSVTTEIAYQAACELLK